MARPARHRATGRLKRSAFFATLPQSVSSDADQNRARRSTMKSLKQLLEMKGGQVYSIRPDAKVIEALQLMAQKDVGALLVMDGAKLAGIISERDYARKVILHGRS